MICSSEADAGAWRLSNPPVLQTVSLLASLEVFSRWGKCTLAVGMRFRFVSCEISWFCSSGLWNICKIIRSHLTICGESIRVYPYCPVIARLPPFLTVAEAAELRYARRTTMAELRGKSASQPIVACGVLQKDLTSYSYVETFRKYVFSESWNHLKSWANQKPTVVRVKVYAFNRLLGASPGRLVRDRLECRVPLG